eukprot:gene32388-39166_t
MSELALLILPLVAAVVYLLWWVLGGQKKVPRIVNLRGYPILGNILDFLPCNILESLEKYTKAYGSLFVMRSFNRRVFVVSDPSLVREILMKRPKHFRRPYESDHTGKVMGISKGLVHSNGALWSRIRRVAAPSFSQKSVSYMLPGVELEVEAWINRLKEQSFEGLAIDMTQEAFTLTIRVISQAAFGLGPDNPVSAYFFSRTFLHDARDLLAFMLQYSLRRLPFWLWRISPWYYFERRALDATIRFSKHCQEVLDYRHAHPTEGGNAMIDTLLERSTRDIAEGGLTDEEIKHNMRIFYIAGSETTSLTINWCCYFLSLHPDVQQKIRQEVIATIADKEQPLDMDCVKALVYTRAVIRETMRLRNAVALIGLDLESDIQSVTLSNQLVVERGDMVWAYVEGAMHSEDIFHHAADFIPERWLSDHTDAAQLGKMDEAFLAFGSGPRVCPVLEAVLAVASLVRAFDVQLACDASEIHRVANMTLAPNKMPLKLALLYM